MRALIDTNIFLDVALARPGAARSGELLDRLEDIPGSAFLAWHTLSNLYYVLAKASSSAAARSFLSDVLA
jgi:predicted nucleic acid-binding protein